MTDRMKLAAELETLVDKHGIAEVLLALADVCADKAEHIQSAWQDDAHAALWNVAGEYVAQTADRPTLVEVSYRAGHK